MAAAYFGNTFFAGNFFAETYFNGAGQGPPIPGSLPPTGGGGGYTVYDQRPDRKPKDRDRERLELIKRQDAEIEDMIITLITKGIIQ